MKQNMGTADRVIRGLVGIVLGSLILGGAVTGIPAILLGVLAAGMLATAVTGVCPGYRPLGISTRRRGTGSDGCR